METKYKVLTALGTGYLIYGGVKLYKGFNKFLSFDYEFDLSDEPEKKARAKLERMLDKIEWEEMSG